MSTMLLAIEKTLLLCAIHLLSLASQIYMTREYNCLILDITANMQLVPYIYFRDCHNIMCILEIHPNMSIITRSLHVLIIYTTVYSKSMADNIMRSNSLTIDYLQ